MTDEELRQLIESNARAIQGNSESISRLESNIDRLEAKIEALTEQSIRTDAKLDRLSDIVLGNYRNIVRVETGTLSNESSLLDVLERINGLEQRIRAMEQRDTENGQ
jgi:septal ring factor EnvC (AmiA/AmiB activator)